MMDELAMAQMNMLLVEDNPADVVFFQEAMQAAEVQAQISVIDNGRDAIRFLRREGGYSQAPRPDVVVLDLNIPIHNGHEVLQELAGDSRLSEIPVAVLTTSTSESNVVNACRPGRCLYFVKTDDFRQLQQIVRSIAAHGGKKP